MGNHDFLPQRGNYRDLIAFQKAECIYDVTYYFAYHYYQRGDRTIDQMVQAARSGKRTWQRVTLMASRHVRWS